MSNVYNLPRSVRDYQIRINSLGVLPVSLLVDGMNGPKTRQAIAETMRVYGYRNQLEMFDSSGINRVHWHWTGGNHIPSDFDRRAYNELFDNMGNLYDGGSPAQQQAFYQPGRVGVSHTLNGNSNAIGLAIAAMGNASERGGKVEAGRFPVTWDAIDGMLERTAEHCRAFDIKVSPWTTLTHAEVQPNIGIRQNNKWDIRVLPDNLTTLIDARRAGDVLRKRMVEKFM